MNQQLATETKIEFHKQRAITYLNMAAKNIILVGHELIAIKKELPHDQFIAWIEANLGVSRIQANNWMRLAENENKLSNDKSIYHLSDTAIRQRDRQVVCYKLDQNTIQCIER